MTVVYIFDPKLTNLKKPLKDNNNKKKSKLLMQST